MHPFKDCSPNVKEGVFIGVHLQNRAGAPTLRRIRPLLTLRAQMADHYVLRVHIKMRSGAYASSRQDTDYAGGVGRSFGPGVC
jgi:hypothetical protein